MLKSLEVQGFKAHANPRKVEFSSGLNLIMGPNYSGKTSLLEAVLFALGGVQKVPGGQAAARNKSGTLKVDLSFDYDGTWHRIERTERKAVYENGYGGGASGTSAVNKAVEDLFGMSVGDLATVCYAQQGASAVLTSSMGVSALDSLIESVTGMTDAEKVASLIREKLSELSGTISAYEDLEKEKGDIAEELEALESVQRRLHKDRNSIVGKLESVRDVLRQLTERRDYLKKQVISARKHQAAVEKLESRKTRLNELKTSLGDLEKEISELAEKESSLLGDLGSVEHLSDRVLELSQKKKEVERLEAEMRRLEVMAKSDVPEISAVEDKLAKLETEEEALQDELRDKESQLAETKHKKKVLEGELDNGVCYACGRPFEDFASRVEDLRNELSVLSQKETDLSAKCIRLSESLSSLKGERQNTKKSLSEARNVADAVEKLSSLKSEAEALKMELASEDLDELSKALSEIRAVQKDLAVSKARRDSVLERINELEAETSVLRQEAESYAGYEEGAEEALKEVEDKLYREIESEKKVAAELQEIDVELGRTEAAIERLNKHVDYLVEQEEKQAAAVKRTSMLKRIRAAIKESKAVYLEETWEALLQAAGQFCSSATGGKLEKIVRVKNALHFVEEGEQRVLASASGTQKALIGLGLKLGLSSLLPQHLGFLLLDEPTADMDEAHSATTMQLLKHSGLQVIAVTHRQLDSSVADTIITLDR